MAVFARETRSAGHNRRRQSVLRCSPPRPFPDPDLHGLRPRALVSTRHLPILRRESVEWREASGKGTIYTFSVMRRVKEPYVIAHVTLAEGPTMLTNIVDCDADKVRIGQPVIVVFQDTENGPPVPMFKPSA